MAVLEGTWEEIMRHAPELMGRRVRLTVLEETPTTQRNEGMLEVLRLIAERQQGQPESPGEQTQDLIRAARNGGMYGLEAADES